MPDSSSPNTTHSLCDSHEGSRLATQRIHELIHPLSPLARAQVVLALRLAGLKQPEIATLLNLTLRQVRRDAEGPESKTALRALREIAKLEFVESALVVQRKYFKALEELPADREHAVAHSRYAGALGVIAEKAALAGGEATQRSETTQVTLTLAEKQDLLARLEEARTLDRQRQGLPPASEDRWAKYLESGETEQAAR